MATVNRYEEGGMCVSNIIPTLTSNLSTLSLLLFIYIIIYDQLTSCVVKF